MQNWQKKLSLFINNLKLTEKQILIVLWTSYIHLEKMNLEKYPQKKDYKDRSFKDKSLVD